MPLDLTLPVGFDLWDRSGQMSQVIQSNQKCTWNRLPMTVPLAWIIAQSQLGTQDVSSRYSSVIRRLSVALQSKPGEPLCHLDSSLSQWHPCKPTYLLTCGDQWSTWEAVHASTVLSWPLEFLALSLSSPSVPWGRAEGSLSPSPPALHLPEPSMETQNPNGIYNLLRN